MHYNSIPAQEASYVANKINLSLFRLICSNVKSTNSATTG